MTEDPFNPPDTIFNINPMGDAALSAYAESKKPKPTVAQELDERAILWRSRGYSSARVGRNWHTEPGDSRRHVTEGALRDVDSVFIAPYDNSWLEFQLRRDAVVVHGLAQLDQSHKDTAITALVSHANESWEKKCSVQGSADFKMLVWEEALRQGVEVTNFAPPDYERTKIEAQIAEEFRIAGYSGDQGFPPLYLSYGGLHDVRSVRLPHPEIQYQIP